MGMDRQGAVSYGSADPAEVRMREDDVITPELVLVDPELARRARAALGRREAPEPEEGPRAVLRATEEQDGKTRTEDGGMRIDRSRPSEPSTFRRPRNRCIVPSVLSTLLGALVVALAVSLKGPPGYYMPPLPSTNSGASTQPSDVAAESTTGGSGTTEAARVTWTPARGAVGYEVDLVRGARTVYREYTLRNSLELPARWRFRGHAYRLEPGVYYWLVRPVMATGTPDTARTVRRTLVVPGARP